MKKSDVVSAKIWRYVLCVLLVTNAAVSYGQDQPSVHDLGDQYLQTQDFWRQFEIAKEIVTLGDPSILPRLEEQLISEDRHVRGNGAFILAGLGDERGFAIIEDILNDMSPRPEAQGIGLAPGDGKFRYEAQVNTDRYYATILFGNLKNPLAVPALIAVLDDPVVNYSALWALGQIGDEQALDPMLRKLDDSESGIRIYTIFALRQLKSKDAIPRLRQLLEDHEGATYSGEHITVAEAAAAAISQLEAEP